MIFVISVKNFFIVSHVPKVLHVPFFENFKYWSCVKESFFVTSCCTCLRVYLYRLGKIVSVLPKNEQFRVTVHVMLFHGGIQTNRASGVLMDNRRCSGAEPPVTFTQNTSRASDDIIR
jgi:hypothetical protein